MPRLNPSENFEPSKDAKYWWLYTRKSATAHAGVTLPGLFQTSQFNLDATAFVAILFGEVYGLYNFYVVGQVTLVYVVGLFLADLIFAICRHIPQGSVCRAQNRKVLANDQNEISRLNRQIGKWRPLSYVFTLLILFVAVFKIISFYVLQGGVFNGLTLAILLSYVVVATLHLTSTGYFLSEVLTSLFFWRERNAFLEAEGNNSRYAVTKSVSWEFTAPCALEEATVDKHKLMKHNAAQPGTDSNKYVLETWGVLTDSQLQGLIIQQKQPEQKRTMAVEGLRVQLQILDLDPAR